MESYKHNISVIRDAAIINLKREMTGPSENFHIRKMGISDRLFIFTAREFNRRNDRIFKKVALF